MTRVVVLGGGPAGLGAAWCLRRDAKAEVTVVERGDTVGGNAGSFVWNGHALDFGSHRLHPSCKPEILSDIRRMLGEDLLDRPRHGRIRLLGRWVHFPLRAGDLVLHAPPAFLARAALDAVAKPFRRHAQSPETFASVLRRSLGPTICRDFYFPYARKIWGREPSELAGAQARRRVSANSPVKLARKVLAQLPGMRAPGAGRFYYPRGGFGRICDAYAREAGRQGAEILLRHTVTRVATPTSADGRCCVTVRGPDGSERVIEADHVWSTIPVTVLARLLDPSAPDAVREASNAISFRAMTLVYVELGVPQFTPFDAHYLPGADVRMTRLSEPRNYAVATEPPGRTVLCAEIPCDVDDATWRADPQELLGVVSDDLRRAGIPLPDAVRDVHVRRLPQAYPIYTPGYEAALDALDRHVGSRRGILTFGRQGLFAHDNTHHALAMAYAAAGCLRGQEFDRMLWAEHRREFATHVVED